jgi:hypothetical protein
VTFSQWAILRFIKRQAFPSSFNQQAFLPTDKLQDKHTTLRGIDYSLQRIGHSNVQMVLIIKSIKIKEDKAKKRIIKNCVFESC